MIYKSSQCFLPSFKPTGLSVQEKKRKIDFKDGGHRGYLGFLIRTILPIFDVQFTPMIPTKFHVNWPFDSGEEEEMNFHDGDHGGHFRFQTGSILTIFDIQVTLMLPTKF